MEQNRKDQPALPDLIPEEYREYIPVGVLAGAATLGLAVARMIERRRARRRSLRYKSEQLLAQALDLGSGAGQYVRQQVVPQALGLGSEATHYMREHSEELAKLLRKRTKPMRKQLGRQARQTNKLLQERAGEIVEHVREQDYPRLRELTQERLTQTSGMLAALAGILAQQGQRGAHTLAERAQELALRAQELAQETPALMQRVSERAQELPEVMRQAVEPVAERAQELSDSLRESVPMLAAGVGERAQALASSAPEAVRQASEATSERAQIVAARVGEQLAETALQARRKSRRGRTGLRALLLGLALGILVAPRSGEALRAELRRRLEQLLNTTLSAEDSPVQQGVRQRPTYDVAL